MCCSLIDDVEFDDVELSIDAIKRDDIRIAAIIETSKAKFQTWIRIGERGENVPDEVIAQTARYLAHMYGGRVSVFAEREL